MLTRRELLTGGAAAAAYMLLPRSAYAADVVSSSRLIFGNSWQGLVGVSGGIPNRTQQSGATINAYTGSAATINTALSNCPVDQYVQLGPGTFNLSSGINIAKSRVTLRGSVNSNGLPTTILNFTSIPTSECVTIAASAGGWDTADSSKWTTINVTGGVSRGSTSVSLASSPSGLAAGMLVWLSAPAGGNVTGAGWSDFFGARPATQVVKVASVSGSTINFAPALNADYWSGTIQIHYRAANAVISLSGVENVSLTHSSGTGHYVKMSGADQCWMKNVKTYSVDAGCYHVYFYACFRCELRHCDISHMTNLTNSTYCVVPQQSSNLLIEDNWFHDCPNVMPMFGLSGSAFTYNYINDLPYSPSDWLSQIVYFHGSHSAYNLFEGNWCPASYSDDTPGSRNNVWLRNRMRGWDASGPKASNTEAMSLCLNHTNLVMAGNVAGEDGFHTTVLTTFSGAGDNFASRSIYNINSAANFERFANYNTVNDGIPAGEALSSGLTLASSYLYTSKPSWFGSLPWPPIDPANYAQSNNFRNIPAGYRAANGTDPAGGTTPPPAAPTSLRIIR